MVHQLKNLPNHRAILVLYLPSDKKDEKKINYL